MTSRAARTVPATSASASATTAGPPRPGALAVTVLAASMPLCPAGARRRWAASAPRVEAAPRTSLTGSVAATAHRAGTATTSVDALNVTARVRRVSGRGSAPAATILGRTRTSMAANACSPAPTGPTTTAHAHAQTATLLARTAPGREAPTASLAGTTRAHGPCAQLPSRRFSTAARVSLSARAAGIPTARPANRAMPLARSATAQARDIASIPHHRRPLSAATARREHRVLVDGASSRATSPASTVPSVDRARASPARSAARTA